MFICKCGCEKVNHSEKMGCMTCGCMKFENPRHAEWDIVTARGGWQDILTAVTPVGDENHTEPEME